MNPVLNEFLEYIDAKDPEKGPATYPWNEWDASNYLLPIDESLLDELSKVQPNALFALSTAVTFWTYSRLRYLEHNPDAERLLEVIAASRITRPALDVRYINPDEWRGPVNGPLITAIAALLDGLQQADYWPYLDEIVHNNLRMARHVLTQHDPFDDWWETALDFVVITFPKNSLKNVDDFGAPVPLSAFIFDADYTDHYSFFDQISAVSNDNPWFIAPS